jgi:hypothetical protein
MFLKRRADYYLGYPEQLKLQDLKQDLTSYAILHTPPYVVGHFMCSNNSQMKIVQDKLNDILLTLYTSNTFYKTHINKMNSSAIHDFSEYFHQLFIVNAGVIQ